MGNKGVGLIVLLGLLMFVPYNDTKYIVDNSGQIRLSRIDRKSILLDYGTFFSPGKFSNRFVKPKTYINPWYIGGAMDLGCFELYVEFKGDTTFIYPGGRCDSRNLTSKFQLVDVPNAFGPKSWFTISRDMTGKYMYFDCKTGLEKNSVAINYR